MANFKLLERIDRYIKSILFSSNPYMYEININRRTEKRIRRN